jgi:LmbE family N-acetylglucosaminyl deacetylase
MKRYLFPAVLFLAAFAIVPQAQMRVVPVDEEQGHVALGLALRHLANAGIYMMATAHPDDENNGLLVMLNRGQGYRTTLATATRGNGGQNEIGPELFEPLGVLRTEELAALHRFDGAEQYFTRAVDFGYTIDIDETVAQWGRDEIIGDYVRLIRTVRPDVISAMSPTAIGPGQHAHHAMSAILSHEAYKAAGDPSKYPDQIKDGLRPWQPRKFYFTVGGPGGGNPQAGARVCRVDLALYDSLLGKTFSEVGAEARSMHKCQGTAQLLALPGPSASTYQLAESTIPGQADKDERAMFDGIDTSIAGLAKLAGARAPKDLVDGLTAVASSVQAAQKKFDGESDGAALTPLLEGLHAVRVLRGLIRSMPIDDAARFEIDFRLRQKEREFQQATLVAWKHWPTTASSCPDRP